MNTKQLTVLWWLMVICVPLPITASNDCPTVSETTKGRLAQYVHEKFKIDPGTEVRFVDSQVLAADCYRKVFFQRTDTSEHIMMFLSPDQRFLFREMFDSTADLTQQRRDEQQRLGTELLQGDFPTKGAVDAAVTIVMFSDFQCPYCKRQAEILKTLSKSEARVIFRNLPLAMHPWAETAAEAAGCLYQQSADAFWSLHDALFENQTVLTPQNIQHFNETFVSKRTDVQVRAFASCVLTHGSSRQVQTDLQFATQHDIHLTPTMFINGVRVEGVRTVEQIRAVVTALGTQAK